MSIEGWGLKMGGRGGKVPFYARGIDCYLAGPEGPGKLTLSLQECLQDPLIKDRSAIGEKLCPETRTAIASILERARLKKSTDNLRVTPNTWPL